MKRKNESMYIMYDEYKKRLSKMRSATRKLQARNVELRDKDRDVGEQYVFNKNMIDITLMNEMISDLLYDMEMMEMYLEYDDRVLLHRKAKNVSDDILSAYCNYGLYPDGELDYAGDIDNTEDIVCNVEIQEEIVELIANTLTERQAKIVQLYFWEGQTQDSIGEMLGVNKSNVSRGLDNSLKLLRDSINYKELEEYLQTRNKRLFD